MGLSSKRAIIRGNVQGVGFRYTARERAVTLELHGYVRNCPDGSVEARFNGEQSAVEAFVDWLTTGPPGATVSSIAVEDAEPTGGTSFEVTR